MIDEFVPFGGQDYFLFLSVMLFSRSMDWLSTWLATPDLKHEANPVARWLGWRWGIPVNILICIIFAVWPLPAIIFSTTSILVASHNFQFAWLRRGSGDLTYRAWFMDRLDEARPEFFLFCLFAQSLMIAIVGVVLVVFSSNELIPFGVGFGILFYAIVLSLFTMISLWKNRRRRIL